MHRSLSYCDQSVNVASSNALLIRKLGAFSIVRHYMLGGGLFFLVHASERRGSERVTSTSIGRAALLVQTGAGNGSRSHVD